MMIALAVMLSFTLGDAVAIYASTEGEILSEEFQSSEIDDSQAAAEEELLPEELLSEEQLQEEQFSDETTDPSEMIYEEDPSEQDVTEEDADPASAEEIAYYESAVTLNAEETDTAIEAAVEETEDEYNEEDPANETFAELVDSITCKWVTRNSDAINLRSLAKFKSGNFGILQGTCSDGGRYAYFAFNRKSDDAVRVVKMKVTFNKKDPSKTTFKYVSRTPVLKYICHGNDMAYVHNAGGSGKDRILIITSSTGGKNGCYIGMIDPASMKEIEGKVYKYWSDLSKCDTNAYPADTTVKKKNRRTMESLVGDHHGYSTIAYDKDSGLIAATVKTDRDLLILKPSWKNGNLSKVTLLRYIRQNKINATSQGIDCDSDFIYTCWSPMYGKLDTNLIQVYDWDGEHVGDINMGAGYEFESLFRINNGGKSYYYASFYHSYVKAYKAKQKYKVRWKKVRKKVNGKWKKVWKYKTKTRWVTKYKTVRNSYCMSIGQLTKQSTVLKD